MLLPVWISQTVFAAETSTSIKDNVFDEGGSPVAMANSSHQIQRKTGFSSTSGDKS